MKVIDSDNYAVSGIETFFFPGGEPHARIPKDFGPALLFLKARTWNDFGKALCVLDALNRQSMYPLWVFAAYLPGARQDRTDGQTPMTYEIYLSLLKRYSDRVYTFDAHSCTTAGRLHKNFTMVDMLVRDESAPYDAYIIAPDKGAVERAQKIADAVGLQHPIIVCDKQRDFATGNFTGFTMPPLPTEGSYVVFDDICDGGGTFNLLAEAFLKDQHGPKSELVLAVSHGIFSKGVDAIHKKYIEILTTDSWCRKEDEAEHPRLTVYPLQRVIDKILEDADV